MMRKWAPLTRYMLQHNTASMKDLIWKFEKKEPQQLTVLEVKKKLNIYLMAPNKVQIKCIFCNYCFYYWL